MKFYKTLIVTVVFSLLLSACGTSETSKKASMSADEILEKSIAAMSEVKSYSMDMKTKQTMTMTGIEEEMNMEMNMKTDIIVDPMQLYMVQEIKSPELGTEEAITTESYFTNDGFYTKDSMTNTWIKYTDEFAESIIELQKSQMNPEEQLNLLKRFTKNVEAEEDADHYILNLEADGEVLMEIVMEVMGLMGEDTAMLGDLFNEMDIKTFTYKIYIDKETFFQTKMDVVTDMAMTIEEDTMTMKQEMAATITNFDGVAEITIPQEAIDNAEEFSFDTMFDLEGMEGIELEDIEIPETENQ